MIVKDSTTNQVHNDSTKNTKRKQKKSIKRLRSDASESGAPERAPPVEKTSQIHDRHRCQRLTRRRGAISDFFSYFLVLTVSKKIAILQ